MVLFILFLLFNFFFFLFAGSLLMNSGDVLDNLQKFCKKKKIAF